FFQAEDGIRDRNVTGVQTCALPIFGATAITTMEDSAEMEIGDFIAAGYNFLPSVLFFVGLAALALGWAPKLGKVVYVYLIYSFKIGRASSRERVEISVVGTYGEKRR